MAGARGLRLDASSTDLIRLALYLNRDIQRHSFYGRRCKSDQVRLPKLWAGFRPGEVAQVEGDGPELADYCARTGHSASEALATIRREHFGLVLLPFAWVSSAWQQAAAVFADLRRYPLRQVFPISKLPDDLIGFQGAAEFNFHHSRFRQPMPMQRSTVDETAEVAVATQTNGHEPLVP